MWQMMWGRTTGSLQTGTGRRINIARQAFPQRARLLLRILRARCLVSFDVAPVRCRITHPEIGYIASALLEEFRSGFRKKVPGKRALARGKCAVESQLILRRPSPLF